MDQKLLCISCQKTVTNDQGSVKFPCPRCGKQDIIRCFSCRQRAAHYTCKACEFTGPN